MPAMPAGDGSGCRSTPQGDSPCCDWLSAGGAGSLACESPEGATGQGLVSLGPGRRRQRTRSARAAGAAGGRHARQIWLRSGSMGGEHLLVRNKRTRVSRVEGSHVLEAHPRYGVKGVKERLRFADQVKRGLFKHLSRTGIAPLRLVAGVLTHRARARERKGPGPVGLSRLSLSHWLLPRFLVLPPSWPSLSASTSRQGCGCPLGPLTKPNLHRAALDPDLPGVQQIMSNTAGHALLQHGVHAWTLLLVTAASSSCTYPVAPICSSRPTRFLATSSAAMIHPFTAHDRSCGGGHEATQWHIDVAQHCIFLMTN